MSKHPALINLARFYREEITLQELEELNRKLTGEVREVKLDIPDVVKRAKDIFGTGNACPKDREDPDSEVWNS